jgi:ribosome maturation factor RimP
MVRELAAGAAARRGCALWDVEYAREGGRMVLRLLIDKPGLGVSTDDCEAVSRAVDPLRDERDPAPGP